MKNSDKLLIKKRVIEELEKRWHKFETDKELGNFATMHLKVFENEQSGTIALDNTELVKWHYKEVESPLYHTPQMKLIIE